MNGILITSLLAGPNLHAALVAVWGESHYSQTLLPNGLNNIKAVAGGNGHVLALRTDGTVTGWGRNDFGQADIPAGLARVVAVGAGNLHSVALKADGTVLSWGFGNGGQTNVPPGLTDIVAIAVGSDHTLGLRANGTVAAWGFGFYGQTNVPAGLSNVIAVAGGRFHSLALKADGTVAAWGAGTNTDGYPHDGQSIVPPGLSNVVAIAAGERHSLALKGDGTVVAWGHNQNGQTNVPAGLSAVTAIAAGLLHNLALQADGTVVAWGYNHAGQASVPPGLTGVSGISAGGAFNLALVFAGPPVIATEPQNQIAAYGSTASFSVSATGNAPLSYQWFRNGQPLSDNPHYLGVTASALAIFNVGTEDEGSYTVMVTNTLGSVLSSGATLTTGQAPLIFAQTPNQTVGAGTYVGLSVTAEGAAPLTYQWAFYGTNLPGRTLNFLTLPDVQPQQSGNYTVTVSNLFGTASATIGLTVTNRAPVITQQPFLTTTNLRTGVTSPVPPGSSVVFNVTAIGSLPLRYQWRFNGMDLPGATNGTLLLPNLALHQSGFYSVEIANAFGITNSAKLLLNVSQVVTAGAPVAGNTNMPLGLTDVTAIAAGGSHLMALKTDGTVRTWLANANYIFGGARAVTNIPASVTNIVAIAAGYDHCLALRSNGTVVAWGGQGLHTNVPVGLSNVVGIAAGWSRSYAVKSDGTVTGWGNSAAIPTGLSNVVAVAANSSQNLALRRDGTVALWTGSGPFYIVPGLSNAIAVAASASVNRVLRADGTVVNWSSILPTAPNLVFDGNQPVTNAVALALGSGNTSLILKQNGALVSGGFPSGAVPVLTNLIAIAAGGVQTGFGAFLLGAGEPAFTLQPVSQTVTKSNAVSLHARTVGALPQSFAPPQGPSALGPPYYQWQHNGANLLGATNASLILRNVLGRDTGDYRLIASNSFGLATSRVATVAMHFNTNLPAALNATNLQWISERTITSSNWFAQVRETHDDDVAAQSGRISHNQTSTVQVYLSTPGTLRFWWKVSSEAGYDFLRVYLDQSPIPISSISGETDWEEKTITITNAGRSVRWVYSKDASVNAGRDAGFLDEVSFSVPPPTVTIAPASQTVGAGANASFFATTVSYQKPVLYQWRHYGTNLIGGTNQTLTLVNVKRNEHGPYSVHASNSSGETIASNAFLNVIVPQQLSGLRGGPDGCLELHSRDADGGAVSPDRLAKFAAQASTNLVQWEILPGALSLTNGALLLRDTNAALHPRRFYRIREN